MPTALLPSLLTSTAEQMAQRYGTLISASHVGRILTGADLRPHRVRGWLTRKDDPLFWDRAADVEDAARALAGAPENATP